MANHNLPIAMLEGGLSVNLNHLKMTIAAGGTHPTGMHSCLSMEIAIGVFSTKYRLLECLNFTNTEANLKTRSFNCKRTFLFK